MTGLELLKAPGTTAGEIADIIAEHCPPVVSTECDRLSCRACWLSWLTTGEPTKGKGPSDIRTAPYHPQDKADERKAQAQRMEPYPCLRMGELRSLIRNWQEKNKAPYSALKICLNAVLASEEKKLLTPPHPQSREG